MNVPGTARVMAQDLTMKEIFRTVRHRREYSMTDYFYGWYFRCQGRDGSIAVIPAVHLSAEKRTRRKSVFEKRDISEIHDT